MSVKSVFGRLFSGRKRSSTKSKSKRLSLDAETSGAQMNCSVVPQEDRIHTEPVMCTTAVSNGVALSGSKDKTVSLYDFEKKGLVERWKVHDNEVTKVAFGDKLGVFFSSSRDKNVCMLRAGSADPQQTFTGHELVVTGLTVNKENTHLCTGSRDNSLRLWDLESGQCVRKNQISRNLVSHVQWAENRDIIAQTGEDKEVRVFDSRTLQVAQTFTKKCYIQTWCDVSEDGSYCLTSSNGFGGHGCEATLWDLRNTSLVNEYKGHHETCHCVRFVPRSLSQGRRLLVTSSSDCSVRVWDQDSKACLACLELPGSGPLTSIAIFNDSRLCVSSYETGVYVLQLDVRPASVSLQLVANF